MKRTHYLLTVVTIVAFIGMGLCTSAFAQELVSTKGKVRVFKGGLTIEGKNLQVNDESVFSGHTNTPDGSGF